MFYSEDPRGGRWSPCFRRSVRLLHSVFGLAVVGLAAFGQTTTNTDGYTPVAMKPGSPAGSYNLSGIDDVSLYTGKANIRIPLLKVGGRGRAGYTIVLPLQRLWRMEKVQSGSSAPAEYTALPPAAPNMVLWGNVPLFSPGALFQRTAPGALYVCSTCGGNFYSTTVSRLTFVTADGTETDLVDTGSGGDVLNDTYNNPASRGTTFVSRDGSFLQFTSDSTIVDDYYQHSAATPSAVSGYLRSKDGSTYRIDRSNVTWMRDANGNQTYFSYGSTGNGGTGVSSIIDSDGRTISISYSATQDVISYPGANGATRSIAVHIGSLDSALDSGQVIETYQQLFNFVSTNPGGTFDPQIVSSVVLPDGTSYSFKYDSYSEVTTVSVPSGGMFQFSYAQGPSNFEGNIIRYVTERKSYSGTALASDEQYSYSGEGNAQAANTATTVNHLSNGSSMAEEVHYFYGNGFYGELAPFGFENWQNGKEYETDYLTRDGGSTLRRVLTTWAQRPCQAGEMCLAAKYGSGDAYNRENYQNDPQALQTLTVLDTNQQSLSTLQYDRYNNVTDRKEYDWGAGAPGGLLRETQSSYVTTASYLSNNLLSLVTETRLLDGSGNRVSDTVYGYDTGSLANCPDIEGHDNQNFAGAAPRGNMTSVGRWLNTSNSWLTSQSAYDIAGNVVQTIDANNHAATYSFADNYSDGVGRSTYAHATAVTNALSQRTTYGYDYNSGKMTSEIDANNVTTVWGYNDPLDRLTLLREAAYGDAHTERDTQYYYQSPTQVMVEQDQYTTGDALLKSETIYDGLERTLERNEFESSSAYIETAQSYDQLGRLGASYNPTRVTNGTGDGLNYATAYSYDALGRVTAVTTSDGAVAGTSYSGNVTTASDAAGHARQSSGNALGWLTQVVEDPGGLNYTTMYSYDAMGDLTGVNQSGQTRSFVYDSLGRLTQATNPESGTVSYSYDSVGNLVSRREARGITATTGYDALNRLTQKSYSDGTPAVSYAYDRGGAGAHAIGQLTEVSNAYGTTTYTSFDLLGRVLASSQQTLGQTYTFGYTYNLAEGIATETYPSGRVMTAGYDGANRTASLTGSYAGAAKNYVQGASYWPHGALNTFTFGNQVAPVWTYNSRLQTASIYATQGNNPNQYLWVQLYGWGGATNNGTLQTAGEGYGVGVSYASLGWFQQSYGYDKVNRLTAANDSGYARSFGYDAYGNVWVTGNSGVPAPPTSTNVFRAANQMAGVPYDAAGNQLVVNGDTLAYDAENRQTSASEPAAYGGGTAQYFYDGLGQRVEKLLNSNPTVYVYDAQGKLAAEYGSGNGQAALCQTCYLLADALGSTRLVTDNTGSVVGRHDYLPFGEEIAGGTGGRGGQWGTLDLVDRKFTGQVRDSETGEDYFGARYYGSALGRFTSPDPLPGWASDPQSWNMYAYGRNNPLKYVDPDGEKYRVCDANGQNCNDLSDADFESEQKTSQSNGEHFNNGSLYHYDSNGSRVNDGTYNQTDVDIDPAAASALHTAGVQSSAQLNPFMRDAATTAAGGLVFSGVAAAVTELAPAAEGLPLLRQVSKVLSNNSLKHIAKHLDEFQKLDPFLTMNNIVDIGTDVAQTGSQVAGNAFVKTVQIGGKEVTVRAVLNSNNALRSVHILQ